MERSGLLNTLFHRLTAAITAAALTAALFLGSSPPQQLRAAAAPPAEIPGIDISKYQEDIDWITVAHSGVKFAILRCCKVIRGNNDWELDSTFEENYSAAKAAGLAVGCYMYTDAATSDEFESDINYMLGFLKDKSFEFPVFLDLESKTRQEHLSPNVFMPALLGALEQIEDGGHTAGVYSSTAFFSECIDREQLQEAGYAIWEANYFNTTMGLYSPAGYDLSDEATIWQYSGNGKCEGIKTTVDRNVCYTYQYFNHIASLVNSLLPSGTMKPGSNFTIAGTVTSETVIRSITGSIYNTHNPDEPVQTVTVYPHAREYKLTGFFTKKLVFSTLPEGDYELRITAVDASDTGIDVANSQFTVSNAEHPTVSTAEPEESEPEQTELIEHSPPTPQAGLTLATTTAAERPDTKRSGRGGLGFAVWYYQHWSLRSMTAKATAIGIKLKLERTPLYRIVSKTFYRLEAAYLTASLLRALE